MASWSWSGARWWRFDFHTHTPASEDYGKGPDQAALKARTPQEWLLDYMRAGVDCVAVTDHNTGAWVDKLKDAYAQMNSSPTADFRPITLFPGVEICVNGGVHVLAILDPGKTTADIDSLLGAVHYQGTKGTCDACTVSSFAEVVGQIRQAGGLAIPAHVHDPKGLFREFEGTTLGQALDVDVVIAIEVFGQTAVDPGQYVNCKRAWSRVLGSDAHHPAQAGPDARYPGSHFTWVKMGAPSLEGLSLALIDGTISLRRSDQTQADPNSHAELVVESIEVRDARYMGRSQPFAVQMNPWLNAVIGGRGTGKSTIVEFLRTTLRREGELPLALRADHAKFEKTYESRENDGLLTENTRVAVIYRKDGARYRIQWNQAGDAPPIEVDDTNGGWNTEPGDVTQRFPVRIYSQKQVFELARDPQALIRIIDEATEVDRRSWESTWAAEHARFLALRAEARKLEAALGEEQRIHGELADVQRRLEVFETAGHATVLQEYQKRLRQERVLTEWERTWADGASRLRELSAELTPDPPDATTFSVGDTADVAVLDAAEGTRVQIAKVVAQIEASARSLADLMESWRTDLASSPWTTEKVAAVAAYGELCKRLSSEGAGDPSEYSELVQRRQMLEGRLSDIVAARTQATTVLDQANQKLEQLQVLRRDLTRRRTDFVQRVLAGNRFVSIEVTPYDARSNVEAEFRRNIQREAGGFEKDIGQPGGEGQLGRLYDGQPDAQKIEKGLTALRAWVRRVAAGNAKPNELADQRFATHLSKLDPEVYDRLDAWFPEDSVRVRYSPTADGQNLRDIEAGSPGQKTAALLAFLLSYGVEPIVLDQPEDDLDNHLIYDLIVNQLREIKQRRQCIVVTHNANIVVNGDAELVVGLKAASGETQRECAASLQDQNVRNVICQVLEGGQEAFRLRYRRIALGG